jgi:chorismate mutase
LSQTDPEQHTLQHYREQLDLLNSQLLHLLELRGGVVLSVMELKRRQGLPTHDPVREQAMLTALGRQARGPYLPAHIELIFSAIFAASRALADLEVAPTDEVAGSR